MNLSESDAAYAADQFIDYFSNMGRIDEYLRNVKLDRMSKMPTYLPGCGPEEDMFDAFDMHPNDMNFKVYAAGKDDSFTNEYFNERLQITTSHSIESSIPGKSLKWIVMETNTKKIVGFIRFGSPTINCKPRNDWLGRPPELKRFNRHSIMGFIIVPTQPFGFNYLGGKLLALLCCSHEAREQLNSKYGSDICLFETTSLYGTTKSSSQYDGLKPYMRSIIKKNSSSQKAAEFQTAIVNAKNLTEKKRVYFSDYGFANSREVIRGDTDILVKNPINFDKFYQENLIKWWKNKASKRYESLKSSGSLRTELEVWTKDMHIDIIR
jgi:hypothetical protein